MKKQIIVAILSLFIIGTWGNIALADVHYQRDSKTNMKVELKKDSSSAKKEVNINKSFSHIRTVEREFNDVQNDWAREEVLEATVKGYVSGYDDFSFRPNAPVTKMETLVLILNSQGYAGEAKNYVLSAEQKALLAKIPDWGKNYIALALDKGILTEAELKSFNPQQGAKRYEVCIYMSRTVNADVSVSGDLSSKVFKDEDQISDTNRKAVRFMWRSGIIAGYPDGSFQPMRVVKRNELVTMLNKLDDNCLQKYDSSTVKGSIKKIEQIEGGYRISIVNDKGETITVKTNSQTKLIYEGILLNTAIELNSSYEVKILLNEDKEAVLVRVLTGR